MDKGSLDSEGLNGGRGLLKSLRLCSQLSCACGCERARAGPATAGGRPPADEFAKQVTAYKCHLKPFVMTAYGFQELHSQLQPANIPFLVDNEIPLALESYCVLQMQTVFNITDTSETQEHVMMSLTSAVP